jgi:hypothetical protein
VQLIVSIIFGGLAIIMFAAGSVVTSFVLVEGLSKVLPTVIPWIHKRLKLEKYGVAAVKIRLRRPQPQLPPKAPVPDDTFAQLRATYSKEFAETGALPFTREALRQEPRQVPGGIALLHPRICCNCGKERKIFGQAGLCIRCSPVTAEGRTN